MNTEVNYNKKKHYEFIDGIRCITMIFIVAEHCIAAGNYRYRYDSELYWTFLSILQLTKFGTITFFLLGGFLIGENFSKYSAAQYLKRRLSNIVWPWLFWSSLFIIFDILRAYFVLPIGKSSQFTLRYTLLNIKGVYSYSSYWFIINFMVSISLLLLFKKYLHSVWLGLILGSCTVFYCVNIYYLWIPSSHTTAILGFVFFLWLGAQLRRHWEKIETLLAKTNILLLIVLFLITYVVSIFESTILEFIGGDKTNTLRFSNILYSLVCFSILIKIKSYKLISYLKPRETTYGIYLIHFILIMYLIPQIMINVNVMYLNAFEFVTYRLVWFLITYVITIMIVMGLNKTRAKKLVGN